MNPNDFERELTRLFTEQRRADEAKAPSFRTLMARARADANGRERGSKARAGRWAWRAAVTTAAVLALSTGLYLLLPGSEPRLASDASALANWKAPTDALLQTPGGELLGRLPVLLDTIPDVDEGAPAARKATPRPAQTKVPNVKGVES
jgi:hypothetical protein